MARPLTDAQRDLAGRFVPLARSLARPFKDQIPDWWDEYESASMLGLVEAAGSFDPGSGVKFATFARYRIRGLLKTTRIARLLRHRAELLDADDRDGCLGLSVLEAAPDHRASAIDRDEAIDAVEDRLRGLPPKHAEALRLIFVGDMTNAEAGREMGLSTSRIANLKREALALLSGA